MSDTAVLVVDVANLVGTTPDGWWRDRVGATRRMVDRLPALVGKSLGDRVIGAVVAVVEGAARDVAAPADLTVLRAGRGRTGDDVIAEHCAAAEDPAGIVVVTADRGLRARLPTAVRVIGPRTLLRLLDDTGGHGPGMAD